MEQVGPARVSEPEQALAMALEPAQVLGLERASAPASAPASVLAQAQAQAQVSESESESESESMEQVGPAQVLGLEQA